MVITSEGISIRCMEARKPKPTTLKRCSGLECGSHCKSQP
jgi:hypothetical protein